MSGIRVAEAALGLTMSVEGTGVPVAGTDRGSAARPVAILIPEPPGYDVRIEYLDWMQTEQPRTPILVDLQPGGELGIGVMQGITMVFHRDLGHLLHCCPKLVHMAGHHHGVVARIEAAHWIVETHVRGMGDELVALPGVDMTHGFETVASADLHPPTGHGLIAGLKTKTSCGSAALDTLGGFGHQPQKILGHDAGHELASEMVGEVRGYRTVDSLEIQGRHIGHGIVKGLLDQLLECSFGPGLGKA